MQQFITNSKTLQSTIDCASPESTPQIVKLFGLQYNHLEDTTSTAALHLNSVADTKRKVLSSPASDFDIFQINGPLINRARLYIHRLQCNASLTWNKKLPQSDRKEWSNICKQVYKAPSFSIKRFLGNRDEEFRIIIFTDASKLMLRNVLYIQEVNTGEVYILQAKNRIVTKQLASKSIPSLELHAISLGVKTLIDAYKELTGNYCVMPIKITDLVLYSDSMVALNWVNSFVNKIDKMQKQAVFVVNHIEAIARLCEFNPVKFKFVAGEENPADFITRPLSFKQLNETCYLSGPKFLSCTTNDKFTSEATLAFQVPNPLSNTVKCEVNSAILPVSHSFQREHMVPIDRYSEFTHLVRVQGHVLKFVNNLKRKLVAKNSAKYSHLTYYDSQINLTAAAKLSICATEQRHHYPEVLAYLENKIQSSRKMSNLVSQPNLFLDKCGIIRVISKFKE